jgi:hypothetical protein
VIGPAEGDPDVVIVYRADGCECTIWFTSDGALHGEPCRQEHARAMEAAALAFAARYRVVVQYDDGSEVDPPVLSNGMLGEDDAERLGQVYESLLRRFNATNN